jgi:hypothetical protein
MTRSNLILSLFLAVLLGAMLMNTGGTFAFWVAQEEVDAGTLTTGTAELTAQWTAPDEEAAWQNLLPEESAGRALTVTNSGAVPLELSASASPAAGGTTLHLVDGTCDESTADAPALDGSLQAIPAAADSARATALGPGETTELCATVTATADLTPGTEIAVALSIEGKQIAP